MEWMRGDRLTKAAGAAAVAGPYVRRLMRDEELRENVRDVVIAANRLYDRLGRDDRLRKVVSDEGIRKDVDEMLRAMQHAGQKVVKPAPRRRWLGAMPLLLLVLAAAAVFIHPGMRRRIMARVDRMMGRQDMKDFEWQESTSDIAA